MCRDAVTREVRNSASMKVPANQKTFRRSGIFDREQRSRTAVVGHSQEGDCHADVLSADHHTRGDAFETQSRYISIG
jgi:hypothetical protein